MGRPAGIPECREKSRNQENGNYGTTRICLIVGSTLKLGLPLLQLSGINTAILPFLTPQTLWLSHMGNTQLQAPFDGE